MPAPRTLFDTLLEIRRLARGAQRRTTRPPEIAPLIARMLAHCQTVAIEKRPAGFAVRLQVMNESAAGCRLTFVFHEEDHLPLTPSEREVAQLLCDGRTLAQIGRLRGVSINTIKSQVRQIFHKLDVETRVGLVRRLCL
jgi:DNA-binding CsgD family transcriptional regulator